VYLHETRGFEPPRERANRLARDRPDPIAHAMLKAMIRPFLIGFWTTLRHMFKKPISVNYPDQKIPMFPKWRGKQVLMRDEDGLEKCVACGLCAVACPADAIYLEPAENDGSVAAGPRYAKIYQIHKTRCIFCGYCEEACPVSAIFMGKDYELAVYSKDDFIWDKADLLVPAATTPTQTSAAAR
jgi:NADH-quinone oxidoreductase subunit I